MWFRISPKRSTMPNDVHILIFATSVPMLFGYLNMQLINTHAYTHTHHTCMYFYIYIYIHVGTGNSWAFQLISEMLGFPSIGGFAGYRSNRCSSLPNSLLLFSEFEQPLLWPFFQRQICGKPVGKTRKIVYK